MRCADSLARESHSKVFNKKGAASGLLQDLGLYKVTLGPSNQVIKLGLCPTRNQFVHHSSDNAKTLAMTTLVSCIECSLPSTARSSNCLKKL